MATRQRTVSVVATAAGINADAAALLAELGITDSLTLAEANQDGYYTTRQLAGMKRGVTEDTVARAIRSEPDKYESVKITGSGGGKAYRLKRKH